jgi:hypothetical protein
MTMRLPRARLARAPALLANSLLIGLAACVSPPAMGPPWDPTRRGYVDYPPTTVIEPGDRGRVDALGNLEITVRALGA